MKRNITIAIPFALILAASGSLAMAQGMPGKTEAGRTSGPGYEVTEDMKRYREMAGVMRDMSQQMSKMQEGMGKGGLPPENQKRMQQQLKEMSDMMKRMSGLADRSSMKDPAVKKETEAMRKQMDNLMRAHP